MFRQARKEKLKLRLALCGPAGSGKTYTALAVATSLAQDGKVAVVDTEKRSSELYADLFSFDTAPFDTFDPLQLIETIRLAEREGYAALVIDSLSHFWNGVGGELDKVDRIAKQQAARSGRAEGNSFAAWKEVTPEHNKLVAALLSSNLHVIVTMRTKTEWVLEKNDKGQTVPRKVGMAPIMRDGIEYEFTVCGDMDHANGLAISKSRCPAVAGQYFEKPGAAFAGVLLDWLDSGAEPAEKPFDKPAFLRAMASLRAAVGDEAYLRVLGGNGCESADDVHSRPLAETIRQELKQVRREREEQGLHVGPQDAPAAQGAGHVQ